MKILNLALRKQHNLDKNIMKPSEKQKLAQAVGLNVQQLATMVSKEKEAATLAGELSKQKITDLVSEEALTSVAELLNKFQSIKKSSETLLILINNGSIPIIVHPERNLTLQNIEDINYLKSLGVLFQLSLGSMISFYPEIIRNTARDFLSKGYYDFIATDFQDHQLLNSEQTNISLNELNSLIGHNKLNQLINTNPKLVLDEDLTNDYNITS